MPDSLEYRAKANECLNHAENASELAMRDLWLRLAMSYANLAELSERSAKTDLVYETPPKPVK